jgi:phenylalanine-4-hydroxylase
MAIFDPVIAEQTPAADFTIEQKWARYTDDEHDVWRQLYDRQIKVLADHAVPEFYAGLQALNLNEGGIPDLAKLNEKLMAMTGWKVVTVPELVPDEVFFEHLANRRFPAGRFIRKPEQLDYIEEPDIFHDVFGHVPLLTQQKFADYMQAYGKGGLKAKKYGRLKNLARIYWYTVEYGLMKTEDGFKIYGAGMSSSFTESKFSVLSDSPHRLKFDLKRVLQTSYRIDDLQEVYFVINSFDELVETTIQDFVPAYKALDAHEQTFNPADILPSDHVYTHGTQSYAKSGGLAAAEIAKAI